MVGAAEAARAAGAAAAAGGLLWVAWAWVCLRQASTDAGRRFVDHGPYAIGRHPMYLGLTLTLLGAAPALGTPALAVVALGFATLMQFVVIPHEEAQLRGAFGGWYSDYAADVRRWL
jgi:protein-S-isoprenylcysteine O-methyltransferase Ste14